MNSMDRMKQEQNRGYVIAGGAAIIAFIAFFLPYVSIPNVLANGVSETASGSSVAGWLWIEFLAVLVVIAVSALFVFKNNLLSGTINMPLHQQIKNGQYLLLGGSILALLIHLLFLLNYSAASLNYVGINPAYSSVVNVSLGFGYWLFMLAGIAMIVGSVLALRNPVAAMTQAYGQQYPPQSTQYPPQSTPYSPYQQPQQPYDPYQQPQQPYTPYQQPYPTADQQPQQPYTPYQQPYPPYQQPYPTADQQPQQPYPPYQNPQQSQQYPPTEMQPPTQQR